MDHIKEKSEGGVGVIDPVLQTKALLGKLVAFKAFCLSSGLTINVDKTKMVVLHNLCLHKREHAQFVQTLNILLPMYVPQINGVYDLSCFEKLYWKINTTIKKK